MIETTRNNLWMFNCPLHGWESEVFCFRAYDIDLVDNWHLFEITKKHQDVSLEIKKAYQKELIEYVCFRAWET